MSDCVHAETRLADEMPSLASAVAEEHPWVDLHSRGDVISLKYIGILKIYRMYLTVPRTCITASDMGRPTKIFLP